jgi:hypothetical protein
MHKFKRARSLLRETLARDNLARSKELEKRYRAIIRRKKRLCNKARATQPTVKIAKRNLGKF